MQSDPPPADGVPGPPEPSHAFGTQGPERTPALSVAPSMVVAAGGVLLAGAAVVFGGNATGVAIAGVVLVLVGVSRVVAWAVRRYELTGTEIRVTSGLLERTSSVVPYSRVQQVDLNAGLIQRAFGLVTVRIGTAGASEDAEIAVDALSPAQAEKVRTLILQRRQIARSGQDAGQTATPEGAETAPQDAAPTPPTLTLSTSRLALAGVTGGSIWLGLGALGGAVLVALNTIGTNELEVVDTVSGFSALALVLMGIGLLVALPALGALFAVLTYGGYQLWVTEEHVRASYGLLSTRRLTVPRHRIHLVTVDDNPVRRRLGMSSVIVQSAAVSRTNDAGNQSSLTVPLLDTAEATWLVRASVGLEIPDLELRPSAARGRAIRRRLWPALVIGGVATTVAALLGATWPLVAGLAATTLVMCVLAFPWGRAYYERGGYAVTSDGVTLASGVLTHRAWHAPLGRVQSAGGSQSPFQRRRDLASLRVDVAGASRAPSLRDMGEETTDSFVRTLPLARS